MKLMTKDDVVDLLRSTIEESGLSHDKFGARHGFNGEVVGLVLRGKRPPGPSIIEALGLEEVVGYRRKVGK